MFLKHSVCLAHNPGVLLALCQSVQPQFSCLKENLVEGTTVCVSLKMNGDYYFLQ